MVGSAAVPETKRQETYRIATWNVELWRKGPGLLLRDLMRGDDAQIAAILAVLERMQPDILALQGFDYDLEGQALRRFARAAGFAHSFALRPNAGRQTGLDINGDGHRGDAEDALGFGDFAGQGGMAILSRFPINRAGVIDHSARLWRDMPEGLLPPPGAGWPSAEVHAALPLSSMGHWMVPIVLAEGQLALMTFHAAPPVFDGPEDRNGRRNHDEIRFWQHLLDGHFGQAPKAPFVLLGQTNQDPTLGEGRKAAIRALLADPRLQDPQPEHRPTVDWPQVDPPRMRVSYVLPDSDIQVVQAGTLWPDDQPDLQAAIEAASRHRLVWVDIALP